MELLQQYRNPIPSSAGALNSAGILDRHIPAISPSCCTLNIALLLQQVGRAMNPPRSRNRRTSVLRSLRKPLVRVLRTMHGYGRVAADKKADESQGAVKPTISCPKRKCIVHIATLFPRQQCGHIAAIIRAVRYRITNGPSSSSSSSSVLRDYSGNLC